MKVYPISEIFTSQQGEGLYTGTRMTFIRLAGCSVGKPFPKPFSLPTYTEQCTLYDGRVFACDTDYRVKKRMTVDEIRLQLPKEVKHVCITGGEPLIHDISVLVSALIVDGFRVHLETSGTIMYEGYNRIWITVSPKWKCLPEMIVTANEIKLLVDKDFDPDKLDKNILTHDLVYIHPVNFEHSVNPENLRRVMELQNKFPNWRVGLQLHKALEHYLKERVR